MICLSSENHTIALLVWSISFFIGALNSLMAVISDGEDIDAVVANMLAATVKMGTFLTRGLYSTPII